MIQDFDMPDISNTVTVSPDGRYIFATGNLSLVPFLWFFHSGFVCLSTFWLFNIFDLQNVAVVNVFQKPVVG